MAGNVPYLAYIDKLSSFRYHAYSFLTPRNLLFSKLEGIGTFKTFYYLY